MTIQIEEGAQKRIAEFFPDAILKAIGSYARFMESNTDIIGSKKYAEHQKAGQVAVAHIHLLLKMAEWANIARADKFQPDIEKMLRAAQNDISHYKSLDFSDDAEDLA